MKNDRLQNKRLPGEAMQAAMKARGCDLTIEESRKFAEDLLNLAMSGALVFYDVDGNELTLPRSDIT